MRKYTSTTSLGSVILGFLLLITGSICNGEPLKELTVSGIFADSKGFVYTYNGVRNKVQKFSPDGHMITEWPAGQRSEYLPEPRLAGISNGTLYIEDTRANRVERYAETGEYIGDWKPEKMAKDWLDKYNLTVSPMGNVYLADLRTVSVSKYDSSGHFVAKCSAAIPGATHFKSQPYYVGCIMPLAPDSSGGLYLYCGDELGYTGRMERLDASLKLQANWLPSLGGKGALNNIYVAADPKGDVFLCVATGEPGSVAADHWNGRSKKVEDPCLVERYSASGKYLNGWKLDPMTDPGENMFVEGLSVDKNGSVYVVVYSYFSGTYVRRFDSSGKLISEWEVAQ